MSKRYILVSILSLIIIGAFNHRPVHAENSYLAYQFATVEKDSLYAAARGSDGCPSIGQDTALYRYELEIDADLLTFLGDFVAAGGTPIVEFRSVFDGRSQGQGEVSGQSSFGLVIEHSVGTRTVIYTGQHVLKTGMVMPGDNVQAIINDEENIQWGLDYSIVAQLSVGDVLLLGGQAQGKANSVGCDSDDQAGISWEMSGVDGDPDRPIITGHVFPAE